jgi:tryptophanyl-tRNA synthetase
MNRATHVPVGEDQSQHLEFARECATNFNHSYGAHLKAPATITCTLMLGQTLLVLTFTAPAKRVMSLQEPHLKMSKSHKDPRSRILLTDSPEEISQKVMAALTDSTNSVSFDPNSRPGVSNLLELLYHLNGSKKSPEEIGKDLAGQKLGALKSLVAETIITALAGIRDRYKELVAEDNGRYLDHLEAKGAEKARANAEATMEVVRAAVGLR